MILRPEVKSWERGHPSVAEILLSHLRSQQVDIPPQIETLVHSATMAQFELWWDRAAYLYSPEEIFDPLWKLPVQHLSFEQLLRCAIAEPLRTETLVVRFAKSRDAPARDRRLVEHWIPWFRDLPWHADAWSELRKHGFVVLSCPSFSWAHRLHNSIRKTHGGRITTRLLSRSGK